ncbi:male sterility protein-domain-containing protein [Chlamydoabsidia padenii]|nr:male sterility protein-domain-containing protein [Chlamydoabsidia padenii]
MTLLKDHDIDNTNTADTTPHNTDEVSPNEIADHEEGTDNDQSKQFPAPTPLVDTDTQIIDPQHKTNDLDTALSPVSKTPEISNTTVQLVTVTTPGTPTTLTSPPPSSTNSDIHSGSLLIQETELPESVAHYYHNKNILLTGATGFVGKAVLWKLIHSLGQSIGRIYLLVRNGNTKRSKMGRPNDRIKNEILNNKAFLSLRHCMGETIFDDIVKNKIIPISGDIISPDLSMSNDDREKVVDNIQVVLHCAATVDYNERLDLSLETNTLGTLRLMDLADECNKMESFVHMSLAYLNSNLPDGQVQERVYPMELGDPEELLKEIVALELNDIPKMTQRILQHYPNTYTFTKSLTEHLILKRVDYNRVEEIQGGKSQWPISIIRATAVGAGASEPHPGWVDGITGMNGMLFLLGQGFQALQPDIGDHTADIVPVDYLTRVIIGSPAFTSPPGVKFVLPYNETLPNADDIQDLKPSHRLSSNYTRYFPVIYHVTSSNMRPINWKRVYDSVRHYWTRNSNTTLPTTDQYFVANTSLFKARMFMKNNLPRSFNTLSTIITRNNTISRSNTISSNSNSTMTLGTNSRVEQNAINRTIEAALKSVDAYQPLLRHQWIFQNDNMYKLESHLEATSHFQLSDYYASGFDWDTYIINFCHGIHIYLAHGPVGTRNLTLAPGWDCALFSKVPVVRRSIIDRQIESVVFSSVDIQNRTERMLLQVITWLEQPTLLTQYGRTTLNGIPFDKEKLSQEWVADFDTSLDDWCHDDSDILTDGNHATGMGRWATRIGEKGETIKIIILNDRRVITSIRQIMASSGVPQQTVVGEALKIVQRMGERTQLPYIWFAGSFLDTLFKRLFSCIRLRDEDIFKVKEQIQGKNVVYIPVSKTLLDQLLVWYICLRYHLPVPAIVCDEALALLGPLSDILRIAGAYFIRRDRTTRSPLNTAVASAYTEVLLHQHGALSMLLERARSRTGRIQAIYDDGILDMVVEATLDRNQQTPRLNNQQSPPPSPSPSLDSRTTETSKSSFESAPYLNRKDTVIVPIHITYEKTPDLRMLIDQVLDQKSKQEAESSTNVGDGSSRVNTGTPLSRSTSFLRRSTSMAGPVKSDNNLDGTIKNGKCGRVYVGIGKAIDIRKAKDEVLASLDGSKRMTLAQQYAHTTTFIANSIQRQQHLCSIISPVSIVAAIVLFGRATNGLSLGKINQLTEWLKRQASDKGMSIDWQDGEDAETIVAYSLKLLDTRTNIVIEGGKRINENTNIRVVDHASNVMQLSYTANQIIEIFLPEAIFSVLYLSFGSNSILTRDDLFSRFIFLVRLLKNEFIYTWKVDETFDHLLLWFSNNGFLKLQDGGHYQKLVDKTSNQTECDQINLFASFIYPTLDAYWITSCSLSALRDLPYMPRKIVPILSQWIAAHLVSGRRTIYREVLSTEASQNAMDNFMAIGFIDAVHPKTKLSPDAQILLLELGIKTNEDLVMVSDRSHATGSTQIKEEEDVLSQLLDIASLCHEIEKFRFGVDDANFRENAHVFDRCQQQIQSIVRADQSYSRQHGMQLIRDEEQMIQLVHSLKVSANANGFAVGAGRNPRRVSEAYNLNPIYRDSGTNIG